MVINAGELRLVIIDDQGALCSRVSPHRDTLSGCQSPPDIGLWSGS